MSSSPDSAPGDWLPYSQREEWRDVTPLQQLEGPSPVVQIAYTDRFRDVYDYFRLALCSKLSEEICSLSTELKGLTEYF